MDINDKRNLSAARITHGHDCLSTAKELLKIGDYLAAANRAYYAIFHAMRSVLAFDDVNPKRHSGIISEFRQRYIKTGIFDKEASDIITKAFNVCNESDYSDFFIIAKKDIEQQVADAEKFLAVIESYLTQRNP